jgi:sensor histidine kinase regulating citrate/malate metabolism
MPGWSVTRRLVLAHCVFITVFTVLVGTAAYVDARDRGYSVTAERMLSVAIAIADNPLVVIAAQSADPGAALQGYTRTVGERADIDVVSILSPAGTRWTHPDEARIGESYPGQLTAAAAGRTITEVSPGVRGPRVRAVVPIHDSDNTVVGLVTAEVETSTVQILLDARLPAILAVALTLLVAGALMIWQLGRHLRRVTFGWGPEELARQFQTRDAVLHSARDGVLLVDRRGSLVFWNDRAADLLGLQARPAPRAGSAPPDLTGLDLPAGIADLLSSGRTVRNEVHPVRGRVLLVSQDPALPTTGRPRTRAAPLGTVITLHDAFDGADGIDDPVVAALIVAKVRDARAAGVRLRVRTAGSFGGTGMPVQDLVAEIGARLDAAIEAAGRATPSGPAPSGSAPSGPAPGDPAVDVGAMRDVTVSIRTDTGPPGLVIEVTGSAVTRG